MKTKPSEPPAESLPNQGKNILDTTKFKCNSNNECTASKVIPDQKVINAVIQAAQKKPLKTNTVIIARFKWLSQRKFTFPAEMELPNLCLVIKNGKLERAFFSNVLTHVIKKQRYFILILN
jgi:hypothetical protein